MRTLAAVVLLASALTAQYPAGAVGFHWSGTTTSTAGEFCWGFSCTPAQAQVTANEVVTLTIRGDWWMAPYVIGFSASATQCTSFVGWYNSLLLDLPITFVFQGMLDQNSPILACPSAFAQVTASLPPGVAIGTTFSLQGAVMAANGQMSFTSAIDVTVL